MKAEPLEIKVEAEIVANNENTSLSLITKAEIDAAVSTAKAFPRSITKFMNAAKGMVIHSEEIAASCLYSVPRAGKSISGPSIRLAEIAAACYGNIRSGARVIHNDGKTVTAQGICHDVENNVMITIETKKSIIDSRGRRYNEDMQVVTGNAACAIALRNAIFKVIPAAFISEILDTARKLVKGDETTLPAKREKAVTWLRKRKIKDEQICDALEVERIEDIGLDELLTLRGIISAVDNGETTLKEAFEPKTQSPVPSANEKAVEAAKSTASNVAEALKKKNETTRQSTELFDDQEPNQ